MAHARPSSGPIEDLAAAARRRRPDADRAPLADDVPPALLARQRHRPRHGHRGIDIALWDILGKVHGVPCHKLWGGPVRDYVRTYCHLGGGKMEDFYETGPADADALRRPGPAGRRRRLHRVQVDGRAADACRSKACSRSATPRRASRRCARRSATTIDIMVDCHARPSPRDGPAVRQGARAVRPVLLRRAVLAGERRRPGRDQRGRRHADRHRRAADEPRTPSATCSNGRACERLPARHHALRRPERSPAHRRAGRGVSHRAGAAQPAGAGQHGRLAGVRLRAAELHHLRNGPRRRALAAGRGAGRLHRRDARAASSARTRGPAWASRSTKPK